MNLKALCRREDGTAAVELALLAPVLAVVTGGLIQLATLAQTSVIAGNAAREGARYGVAGVRSGDANLGTEIQTYAKGRLNAVLDTTKLTVAPTVVAPSGGTPGSVTVVETYPMTYATPVMQRLMGSVTVRAQAVM